MESLRSEILGRLHKHLDELPVLPTVLVSLLQSNPDGDDYFERVERYVSSDPAFAARLVRYANSPMSAPVRPIAKVHEALSRLGASLAVNLILAASATRVFVPRHAWARGLWTHSLGVASMCRRLAPLIRGGPPVDPDLAHLAGLLHDLGRFILYLEAPDELRRVNELDWSSPAELIQAERRVCGFTHTELGALAAKRWSLPTPIADTLLFHHDDVLPGGASMHGEVARIVSVVRAADWLELRVDRTLDLETLPIAEARALLSSPMVTATFEIDRRFLHEVALALRESAEVEQAVGLG